MNIIKNLYSKGLAILQREIKRGIRKNLIIESMKAKALSNTEYLIEKSHHEQKIIVSLTTFGKRINSVFITLESLSTQTLKADRIVLWLAEDEFDNDSIPLTLKNMQKWGLEIKFCKDYKSYKKIIPALKEFPNEIIITVDDDMIYPYDFIEQLHRTYLKYPGCICCNLARKIKFNNKNVLAPYITWEQNLYEKEPSFLIFPVGVGGTLYFPGCFDEEVLNEANFMKFAPKADDIWLKLMSLKNNVKCKVVDRHNAYNEAFIPLDSSMIDPLGNENVTHNENDKQLKAVSDFYSIKIPID